ncbi:thiolase family protein [Aeromicrobium sp.]|uniref:thiolase family protein n=1 Tax=Aeromicrobium sp. TaxID=1871063 RepID=UPI003C48DEDB
MAPREVVILDAVRTPVGRYGGALAHLRPDDLAAATVRSVVDRAPFEADTVDEIVLGAANQAGEDNRNVARMAALLAGFPTSTPGRTVNRLCASGLDAMIDAWRQIAMGEADVIVAGGVESMTRAPHVVPSPERAFPAADATMYSTTLGWRLVNPDMDPRWTVSLGEATEILVDKHHISRDDQDAFAARSHERAAQAWKDGVFDDHLVHLDGVDLERDEGIRDTSPEALAALKPVFREAGTVTAGNSSQISDGAAALVLASADTAERLGVEPMARIVSSAAHAVDPDVFGEAPVEAVHRALDRADRRLGDVTTMELNEAFAGQSLACLRQWHDLDDDLVNPWGGAIALGHPLGCSGARIAGAVAHQLKRTGSGVGVATLCVGVGQGVALVLER